MLFQEGSRKKFCCVNAEGIDAPAEKKGTAFHKTGDRFQQCCHSINREHPNRGLAQKAFVFFVLNGMEARPETFQTPAKGTAGNKV